MKQDEQVYVKQYNEKKFRNGCKFYAFKHDGKHYCYSACNRRDIVQWDIVISKEEYMNEKKISNKLLNDVISVIGKIENPYPQDIFSVVKKVDYDIINTILNEHGYCLDNISADIGRKLHNSIKSGIIKRLECEFQV